MNAPRTGWEVSGEWSTLAEEATFLDQVASETDANVGVAGYSVLGNPIWSATIGNPNGQTLSLGGGVHGIELSGREAALVLLRDMAYTPTPEQSDWLQDYQLLIIPNINADGIHAGARNNARGLNLNRDYFQLTQPEIRAVISTVRRFEPRIHIDLHEMASSTRHFEPRGGDLPGAESTLDSLAVDLQDDTIQHISGLGWNAKRYPGLAYAGAARTLEGMHILSMLVELGSLTPRGDRMDILSDYFARVMWWQTENEQALENARQASITYHSTTNDPIPIPKSLEIDSPPVTVPGGVYYPQGHVPQKLLDLHGITRQPDGGIPTAQPARLFVAGLFDEASYQYVMGNEWWTPHTGNTDRAGVWAKQSGVLTGTRSAWVKRSGVHNRVASVWTKKDGVMRRA